MTTYLDILKQYYKENMFDYLAERKKYLEKTLDVKYVKNGKDWVISDENEEFFKIITFGIAN